MEAAYNKVTYKVPALPLAGGVRARERSEAGAHADCCAGVWSAPRKVEAQCSTDSRLIIQHARPFPAFEFVIDFHVL